MKRLTVVFAVLACISLNIVPAITADFTLGIFGNANMDDTIDEEDIEYVQGILDGTNDETELSDANYDGQIDKDDIVQIKSIIDGVEKELTVLNSGSGLVPGGSIPPEVVKIHKPAERV